MSTFSIAFTELVHRVFKFMICKMSVLDILINGMPFCHYLQELQSFQNGLFWHTLYRGVF